MSKMKELTEIKGEIWKDIFGFEKLYQISQFGRVCSYPKMQTGYKRIIKKHFIKKSGYVQVTLKNSNSKLISYTIHRLVAIHFIDNVNNYKEVNHLDGNKLNNFYTNLEWSTRSLNVIHAFKNGLRYGGKGERNNNSILNKEQVEMIYKSNDEYKEISKKFSISTSTVYDIKTGRSWYHITKELGLSVSRLTN